MENEEKSFQTLMKKQLLEVLTHSGVKEATILLNGRYLKRRGHLVYIALVTDKKKKGFSFYIKENSETGVVKTSVDVLQEIFDEITSTSLGDFKLHGQFIEAVPSINLDGVAKILSLTSKLYEIAMHAMYNLEQNKVTVGKFELNASQLDTLRQNYVTKCYIDFYDFCFSKAQRTFLSSFTKKYDRFYRIENAFVPCFIQHNLLYNPIGPQNQSLLQTDLWAMCQKTNRYIEIVGRGSCYLLTHLEICQALHLKRFMRFPPDFLYKVIAGTQRPDLFPNKWTYVKVTPDKNEVSIFKDKYTEAEYDEVLKRFTIKVQNSSGKEYEHLARELEHLLAYRKLSSLAYECEERAATLKNYARSPLDKDVNFVEILEEVSM